MRIWAACAVVAVFAGACTARTSPRSGASGPAQSGEVARCIDRDSDGFGQGCAAGADCDDTDRKVHVGCLHCAMPSDGCACKPGSKPTACFLDKTTNENGEVMCHEGTRYCREGHWSGCESVFTYPQPKKPQATGLIDTSGMLNQCNDCNVACFRISDNLDPVDGGLADASNGGVDWANGGGLTLQQLDGGTTSGSGNPTSTVTWNPPACTSGSGVGNDADCDGIPDDYDPYPNATPFATANPSIFLQIGPGQTGTGQIDLKFFLNSADVFFLMDQTGSMAEERDALKAALTTGDYINDASYNCADYDFDRLPNNELKTKGVLGAIRCKIRDANFGTAFFREIPFGSYANADQTVFWNYSDITSDVDAVLAAINRFENIGNNDWPEADTVALYNVLTGSGLYFGTKLRGVPPRITPCSGSDWGYPCFRQKAIPIIVLFTDAPLHNGPDNNTQPYGSTSYSITAGTGDQYYPLANTNETFNGSAVLGDLTSSYKTFTGDTTNMQADLTAALVGSSCISDDDGKDALFQFTLTQQKAVTIESTGSQFDTVLGLFAGVPGSPTDLTPSTNMNDSGATAGDMGTVTGNYVRIAGDTSSLGSNYGWSEVGCDASTTAPAAVYKFTTTGTTQVALDTSGSSFDTVVGLYSGTPPTPPTVTAIANTNDNATNAYNAGDIYNANKAFSGDTTSLAADYTLAQVGCNANSSAHDAVFSFTMTQASRVRLSTEGSSFDTVLSLYDNLANPIGTASVPNTNETQPSAYNVGTLDGKVYQLSGSTLGMAADYPGAQVGCNATDTSPDALFKFHLNAPADVQVDTIGSSWDTVLGIFNQTTLDPNTYLAADNQNEAYGTPSSDIGTANGKDFRITGNTSFMTADYSRTPDDSCASSDSSPDAVFRFHLDSATQMRFDTSGTGWDTTVSLHRVSPTEPSTPATTVNDTQASVIDVGDVYNTSFQRTGDTTPNTFNHDYTLSCASTTGKDVVYKFSLSQPTTVQIDTLGTSWDTVLGLYSDASPLVTVAPSAPNATDITAHNYDRTTAYDAGAIDGTWKRYSGTTNCSTGRWTQDNSFFGGGCYSSDYSPAVFYQFSVTAASKTVNVSTNNTTAFDATIYLYKYTNLSHTSWSLVDCDRRSSGLESITSTLANGDYFVVVKGRSSGDKGSYVLSIRDTVLDSNEIACNDDNSGNVLQSTITQALPAGTYYVIMSGRLSTNYGEYAIRFRDKTWWNGEITCNNDIAWSNTASRLDYNAPAGDYWVIVKGRSSTAKGAYSLRIADLTHPPSGTSSVWCDDDGVGGSSTQSKIVQTSLAAGDYWVALKGKSSTGNSYRVNIADMAATASGARLTCDDNGGDTPSSMIERDLQAGTYQVIVKGKNAADAGAYKLFMRDVTKQPINRLACANDGGAGTSSYLESSLAAGTYYAVVKGNSSTDSGAYSFSLRDVTSRPISSATCNDNGSTYNTSKITTTLNAGTYYIALKGKTVNDSGPYQLSVGGGTTHSSTFAPPVWSSTLTALQNSQARVISILSCHDDPSHGDAQGDCNTARTQATSIANASDALGANLAPLVFDISRDGTGLSTAVVDAVGQLAKYLEMNVTARVVFEPDTNPGFNVTVHAIAQAGDGCNGVVGVTHQRCSPGATPRFTIDFENPLDTPVPLNPNDPQGGYSFRAELIADNQFVVEQVPIYIIPVAAPAPPPPPPMYASSGTYWQDTSSPGCKGNQAPDWRDLSWVADVYGNTSVTFNACTADTLDGLSTCMPHTIATITGAGACMADSDCTIGYCDTNIGVCQVARAGTCTSDGQCPANAVCDTTAGLCTFTSQPVYIGGALGNDNYKAYMRMGIDLAGTQPFTAPPVVHSWEMTYLCNQVL